MVDLLASVVHVTTRPLSVSCANAKEYHPLWELSNILTGNQPLAGILTKMVMLFVCLQRGRENGENNPAKQRSYTVYVHVHVHVYVTFRLQFLVSCPFFSMRVHTPHIGRFVSSAFFFSTPRIHTSGRLGYAPRVIDEVQQRKTNCWR